MSQANIDKEVIRFQEFIEASIRKYKPVGTGTKGTINYVSSLLKNYGENFIKCIKEVEAKANGILKEFNEEKEGEGKILKESLVKAIRELMGQFKKANWG